ncbi:MAG: urease accessory protein UreD [Pseudomonadota bacterium]
MLDRSTQPHRQDTKLQRVRGAAMVRLGRRGLLDLRQQGSAKAMLPRTDAPHPEVVFLNTAGGVTSGDRLDYALTVDGHATGTTQTAERAYRAPDAPGEVRITLDVTGRLDWLPQETILFEGSALRRRTDVRLGNDAEFLGVETLVLGRAAHGEVVRRITLDDHRRITRGGRLLYEEHLALTSDILADPACLGGARAMSTLVFLAPGAADALGPIRDALGTDGHASAWDGRLVARLMAADAAPLRRALIRAIVALRGDLPRVWPDEGAV